MSNNTPNIFLWVFGYVFFKNNLRGAIMSEFNEEIKEVAEEVIKKSWQREALEWVVSILIAVVLALVIRQFVFTVVRVDGASMEPTLQHNDRLIEWRLG